MIVVWIALGAIAGYEILALFFTHWLTWSQLIFNSVRGHPKRAIAIFGVVVLIAGHLLFGWFRRHHDDRAPQCAEIIEQSS